LWSVFDFDASQVFERTEKLENAQRFFLLKTYGPSDAFDVLLHIADRDTTWKSLKEGQQDA